MCVLIGTTLYNLTTLVCVSWLDRFLMKSSPVVDRVQIFIITSLRATRGLFVRFK